MLAKCAERQSLATLRPVVDDDLVHDVGERELDGAHRSVGDDERAFSYPGRLQQRLRLAQTRSLDDDVGAFDAGSPIVGHHDAPPEIALEALRERAPAFNPPRVHADLI